MKSEEAHEKALSSSVDMMEKAQVRKALSAKQWRFVNEYLVDFNGKQAACRAGYAVRSAANTASRLLALPEVIHGIRLRQNELDSRHIVTQEAVVKELAAVGFANLKDVCSWNNGQLTMIASHELTDAQAASIAEITETVTSRGGTVRVKQHSKLKALEMLAKHVGLYEPQMEMRDGQALEELSPVLKKRLEAIYGILSEDSADSTS